jgi:hypothetical protein
MFQFKISWYKRGRVRQPKVDPEMLAFMMLLVIIMISHPCPRSLNL